MDNTRRVRFTLPETKFITSIKRPDPKVHGTLSYRNGTLIRKSLEIDENLAQKINSNPKNSCPKNPNPCIKTKRLSSEPPPDIVQQPDISYRRRPSLPDLTYRLNEGIVPPRLQTTSKGEQLRTKHVVILNNLPTTKTVDIRPMMVDNSTICDRYFRIRLFEDMFHRKDLIAKQGRTEDVRKHKQPTKLTIVKSSTVGSITKSIFCPDYNTTIVGNMLQRWRNMRERESAIIISDKKIDPVISFGTRLKSDVKRFACLKMSLERMPQVTTLLRAARAGDEDLLKIVLRKILIEGISKEALNSTDRSGRTAISYICSTNLTNFLDILLQIQGIDYNKPDNEGNTPLHFAAQAGQTETINMLVARCRNLQVDAKNNLGFTPLMKAALQGRTRCAKLLLFAGASPVATDSGRGLRAEEWARFCGRYSCAEMLEKSSKVRLLEKAASYRSSAEQHNKKQTVSRSKTNPCPSTGTVNETFSSKLLKVFPFRLKLKGKSNNENKDSRKSEMVANYLTSTTLCATGPALPAKGSRQVVTTLLRPLEVPKLEVSPAENMHLIRKYEAKANKDRKPEIKLVTYSPRTRN